MRAALSISVEHAIGSLQNPMSDGQLEAKFHGLSDPVPGTGRSAALIHACWAVGGAPDVRALSGLSRL